MAVLPWVNLPENRVPDLLGGIGDTLVAAADRKRQEKQRAAEMLMKQREQDRQDQLAQAQIGNYASEAEARKANEARIAAGEKRQQGLDVAGAIPTIKSMLTPGSPNYDPESAMSLARAHGIDLQKVAAPLPPVEEGPRISPDDAQQAGLITSQQQTPSGSPLMQSMPLLRTLDAVQGAGSDQRAIQQAEAERQRFADANTQKPASRLDTYSGNSPIGPVSIDPNASLEARRFAQGRTRSELAPLVQAVPPQYRTTIQAMIQSGNYDAKSIQAAITEAQKEAAKDSENSTYKEPETERERHNRAMEAAAMANAHARATAADPSDKNDTTIDRNLQTYMAAVKEFEGTAGVNKDVALAKNLGKIHEELTKSPQSPIAQAAAIDTVAQMAQGGKASQGVMNQINAHALGPLQSAYDKAYQVAHNGVHSPAWVKSMQDTVAGLNDFATQERGRVMKGFEAAAGDESAFATPAYSKLRESQRRKLQAALGMDVDQARPAEPGAMQPGSGKRPSNPLVDAAKKKGAPPPVDTDAFAAKYGF